MAASWWTFNYSPDSKSLVVVLGKEAHLLHRDPQSRDDWQFLLGAEPLPASSFLSEFLTAVLLAKLVYEDEEGMQEE